MMTCNHPQPAADNAGGAQATAVLVATARELLARTAELPDNKRELLSVLGEYRTALYAFATQGDRD